MRLLAAFVLVAAVVALAQVVSVARSYRSAEAAALDNHVLAAKTLAAATDAFLGRYITMARTSLDVLDGPRGDRIVRHALLDRLRRAHPEVTAIVVIDPAGRVIDAAPADAIGLDLSDRPFYRRVRDGAAALAGDVVIGRVSRIPIIPVAAASRAPDGRLRGLIVVGVAIEALGRELGLRLTSGVYPVVLDSSGQAVFNGASPAAGATGNFHAVTIVSEALAGRSAVARSLVDPVTGVRVLGAAEPVTGPGWAVAALQPVDLALAGPRQQLWLGLTTVASVLSLGVLLAVLLGTRLARPVAALDAGVRAVASGELGHRLAVTADDEFGRLSQQFNAMATGLEASRSEAHALTDELRTANAQLSESEARFRFLAEASRLLASSLDLEATLRVLADLIVPQVADGFALDLLQPDGRLDRAAVHSFDPAWLEVAREIARSFPRRAEDEHHPAGRAIRTGRSILLPEVTETVLESVARDPALRETFRRAGARSYMVVPLLARGRVLGTLTFSILRPGRHYGEADVALAEDLAQRTAFAIDNARLFREAQEAIREALAASHARDAFLARASHELRTPLTSVVGTIRLLRRAMRGALNERPDALVDIADRNLAAMSRLVEDLLDVSKLAAAAEALVRQAVDVRSLVDDTLRTVGPLGRDKSLDLVNTVPAGLLVYGDRFKLEQILVNLVANAIKFTPAGGRVVIEADLDGDDVVLRVCDTGEGIASEYLERIFDPFFQAAKPRTGPRGTGLGLTISRQLAVLHGGRLWAESDGPGKGARFLLRLPAPVTGHGEAA